MRKRLNAKEIKDVFRRYDINTLETISVLLDLNKKTSKTTRKAFKSVYLDKLAEDAVGYDQREESSIIDKLLNFDLSEITEDFNSLTNEQMNFIYEIVSEAAVKLEQIHKMSDIAISQTEDFLGKYSEKVLSPLPVDEYSVDNYSEEEMLSMLDKLNLNELKLLERLLVYVPSYNLNKFAKCFIEIKESKEEECIETQTIPTYPSLEQGIIGLKGCISRFNENELSMFELFTADAYDYLISMEAMNFSDEDEEETVREMTSDINAVASLESAVFAELEKKSKKNTMVYKYTA